ncbi:MAG: hypothetical protein QGH70_08855 [Nitrospinota bacterium]|jgi:hypothetical protein|nr:hypothetical protein [Nitrospinota bacterium]MDP6483938.1 hypothetical protein [Nitrospinota bacterium]MDP6618915.1 hypothetical protein [Nitrospinota bacterium]MDP7385423.1 hypothetical protein [Nitrospinota bacterium]HJM42492.1 hypothetical protein [Nitrospinota bacterium]
MKALKSYAYGEWIEGAGEGRSVHNAVTGAEIASVDSGGLDFKRMLDHRIVEFLVESAVLPEGVRRFMLRVALQGSPERFEALCAG